MVMEEPHTVSTMVDLSFSHQVLGMHTLPLPNISSFFGIDSEGPQKE